MKRLLKKASNQKLLKDIVIFTKEELLNGKYDFWVTINGQNLDQMNIDEALKLAEQSGIVNGDNILIPQGSIILKREFNHGAEEFTFDVNGNKISADLVINDEYID